MGVEKKVLYPLYALTIILFIVPIFISFRIMSGFDLHQVELMEGLIRWRSICYMAFAICFVNSFVITWAVSIFNREIYNRQKEIRELEKKLEWHTNVDHRRYNLDTEG